MIRKFLLIIFAYLYSIGCGWCEGRLWRCEYDDDFTISTKRYHIMRWFVETLGIFGMVTVMYFIGKFYSINILACLFLFISTLPIYEGFFRIARKDTWFYSKVSKWLMGIPHIKWYYEAIIFVISFTLLIWTIGVVQ